MFLIAKINADHKLGINLSSGDAKFWDFSSLQREGSHLMHYMCNLLKSTPTSY